MKSNPVNWFEIPVSDFARATSFYQTIFGLQLTEMKLGPNQMAWFPMEQGLPGAAGTLVMGEGYVPSTEGTLVYFPVADIEQTLEKVASNGGKMIMPKQSIGEYGFIGLFIDTEGNRVGLHTNVAGG